MQDSLDIVQSALENIDEDAFYMWRHHAVPRLESWMSPGCRAILLDDAAHAIPPTFGQGVNQAFEEAITVALILSKTDNLVEMQDALTFWHSFRQERIGKIIELSAKMNKKRLPAAEWEKIANEEVEDNSKSAGRRGQFRLLYEPHLEEKVLSWVNSQSKLGNEKM